MKHLMDEETLSRTIRRSKNPADHIWQCPICGNIPPLLLSTGWYVKRPCACQRRNWQKQEPHPLPRTLDEALRLAQQGQTYTWLGREWADGGLQQQTFATFHRARQPKAFDLARQFALNPSGVLALYGSYGLGKTHLLAAIANARNDVGDCCLFASAVTLFDAIQVRISRDEDYSGNREVRNQSQFWWLNHLQNVGFIVLYEGCYTCCSRLNKIRKIGCHEEGTVKALSISEMTGDGPRAFRLKMVNAKRSMAKPEGRFKNS